jgi:hypothetical protein
MFQLAAGELDNLKFQFGTSSYAHGGRRKPVRAFTEQGVAMLSSVLHTLWSQVHSDALPVTVNRQHKELVLMEKPAAYAVGRKRR